MSLHHNYQSSNVTLFGTTIHCSIFLLIRSVIPSWSLSLLPANDLHFFFVASLQFPAAIIISENDAATTKDLLKRSLEASPWRNSKTLSRTKRPPRLRVAYPQNKFLSFPVAFWPDDPPFRR